MSSKTKNDWGIIVLDGDIHDLRQELFMVIKSFGLKEEQQQAIDYIISRKLARFHNGFDISGEDFTALKEKRDEWNKFLKNFK